MASDKNSGSDRSTGNPPPTKPASWRQAQAGSTGAGSYWKQRYRNPAQSAATTRRLKLAGLALTSLLLLTALVVTLLYFPRPLTMMTVVVTDFESPLPPNALAAEDIQRIQTTIGDHKNFRMHDPLKPAGDAQGFLKDFRAQLAALQPKGPIVFRRKAVVIYLSAHGVVDENGNACFLTSQVDPLDASTWLKAAHVLSAIKESPNLAAVNKLVLIDAGRMRQCWPLGVLHNSFADRLEDAVRQVNDPQLYVINSTSHDQRGWHAPELSGTAFGYFATEGLAGAANEQGRTVTLQELYAYLLQRVDNFARQYRDASQQPRLLTTGPIDADFPIAYATDQTGFAQQPLDLGNRPHEVARLWDEFARLGQQRVVRYAPRMWAEAESRLVRLETLIAAGWDYDDQYLSTRDRVQQLFQQLAASRSALSEHQASVARARQGRRMTPTDLAEAKTQFENWLAALAQPDAEKPLPTPRLPYHSAAVVAWDWLVETAENRSLNPVDIARACDLVNHSADPPDVEAAEIHFARILLSGLAWDSAAAAVGEAVQIQRTAEELAAPEDIRSHYWAKSRLNLADHELRAARDQLFVGTAKQLNEAQERWAKLAGPNGQYAQARQLIDLVSTSWSVRDESLAVSPHFAKWVLTYPHLDNRDAFSDTLQTLIHDTQVLSRQLDDVPVGQTQLSSHMQRLTQTLASVQASLSVLQGAFDRCCQDLYIKSTYDQRSLAQIASLLAVPLIPQQSENSGSHIRNVLRDRFIQQRWQQPRNLETLSATVTATPADDEFLTWLVERPHPVLELFNDADFKAATTATITGRDTLIPASASATEKRLGQLMRLEGDGGMLRTWLSQLDQTGHALKQSTDKWLDSATVDQRPCDVRRGLGKADRLFRAAASLIAEREMETDFVRELRSLDQQFFSLWHGERALRDFWGPAAAEEPSYFAKSAHSHIQEAMRLYPPAKAYQEELSDTLDNAVRVIDNWSPLTCEDLRVASDEPLVKHRMVFDPLPTDLANQLDFGAARAAISVAEFDGLSFPWLDPETNAPLERRPLAMTAVSAAGLELTHTFQNNARLREAGMLQGVTFFRGHRRSKGFRVSTGPTAAVVYERPQPPLTTVRVRGDQTQKSKIVFVLDCSASMSKEGRFAKAKGVLRTILERLDADNYEIGLFAYGHRAGWRKISDNPLRYQKTLAPNAPPTLSPGDDVELLFPLDEIKRRDPDTGIARDIRPEFYTAIRNLKWRGETPLYYACVLAAQEFAGDASGQRHVVVITDGVNDTENPRTWKTVRDTYIDSGIHLEIVGFQIEPDSAAARAAYAELRDQLAPSSDLITFRDTSEVDDLQQAIVDALRLGEFELAADGNRVPPGPLDLSGAWKRNKADFQPGPYEVRIVNNPSARSDVRLDGGEALELFYRDGALVHERFEFELEKPIAARSADSKRFFVGIHTPKNEGGLLAFNISVQNGNARLFSPRPEHAWAIIRPVIDGEPATDAVYYGHECEFVPERPVPVLRYRVSGWPEKAYEAEIILKFTLDPAAGNQWSTRLDLSGPTEFNVADVAIRIVPRPAEGDGFFRIAIEEDHDQRPDFAPLRLQFIPPASRARHVVDLADRTVRHVFSVEPTAIGQREARLLVTTASDMRNWVEVGPVRVEVPIR